MSKKIIYTDYWIFMCNPKKWDINDFLNDLKGKKNKVDSWTIQNWQYEYFKPGQYGIVRVGKDNRTKKELNGKSKLVSGVYAIVKVLSTLKQKNKKFGYDDKYNIDKDSSYLKSEYYVDIEYIADLISTPLTFDYLKQYKEITDDKYLINGFQTSTIPLSETAFNKILELSNTKLINNNDIVDIDSIEDSLDNMTETEKEAIIKIRIGQSELRRKLISKECKCKICGLNDENFLIASHIKPWSKSNNFEKKDINNVFLLCPNHDALFDKGYISFDDDGNIIISINISEIIKAHMDINDNIKIEIIDKNRKYLEWHRNNMK